jgi:tetratricopeptide (TPR) repeat protein
VRIAVATGRAPSTLDGPPGVIIDRATALLASSPSPGVRIDEVTAGLLGAGFEVTGDGPALALEGARADDEVARMVLGKRTPCVGRDKEISLLEATLRECADESVARAVLVTAPAGQGKSRLTHEIVVRARADGRVRVWTARGDPIGSGSAFVLARQLVRQASGLGDGASIADQREALHAHLRRHFHGEALVRVAAFLGELAGVPPETVNPALLAARNDARIMAEQLRRAYGEWIAAESAAGPVLIVLEDLHWGDSPTVMYLGDALRMCRAAPLMVLALARPEVHERFPRLWAAAEMQEVRLGPLTKRAAANLTRSVLGDDVGEDVIAGIVERSAGNPFFIEELIRRANEGRSDTLPETVLALAQSRLEALAADARHILRAASIFGDVFWEGAVSVLVGGLPPAEMRAWLESLVAAEVLVPARGNRFAGDREYAFRHSLLREAAYAMLTEGDRASGHRLAAQWLEIAGEKDSLRLADHYERGGDRERAASFFAQAALATVYAGDLTAEAIAARGIAIGATGEVLGTLRLVHALVSWMAGEISRSSQSAAREAVDLLPPGSVTWFLAASTVLIFASIAGGDLDAARAVVPRILELPIDPEPSGPYAFATKSLIDGLRMFGQFEAATMLHERLERLARAGGRLDPAFCGWMLTSRAIALTAKDPAGGFRATKEAAAAFEAAGSSIGSVYTKYLLAMLHTELGDLRAAENAARDAIEGSAAVGASMSRVWSTIVLAVVLLKSGRAAEAVSLLSPLLETFDRVSAQFVLAEAQLELGELADAERNARAALEARREAHSGHWIPVGAACVLAQVALLRDRPTEALHCLDEGYAIAGATDEQIPSPGVVTWAWHLRAEAMHALGHIDAAHDLIRRARDRLERIAAPLEDPGQRAMFLAFDRNARTLSLAREWLGD